MTHEIPILSEREMFACAIYISCLIVMLFDIFEADFRKMNMCGKIFSILFALFCVYHLLFVKLVYICLVAFITFFMYGLYLFK
jgi:hypothetical protein